MRYGPGPVFLEPLDPNERFRARRRQARRRRRLRRTAAVGVLLAVGTALGLGATQIGGPKRDAAGIESLRAKTPPKLVTPAMRPLPDEIRGVHVTMALASLKGKLDDYMALSSHGLNTLELDVKDENGEVGFVPSSVPLARAVGAAKPYYKPRLVVREAHSRGLYLIGRVVCFEDPVLAAARPELAVRRPDGSPWRNNAGLGWTNPYDERVWNYNLAIAEAAARAGFDEIQFDYVRFPSDGDVTQIAFPGRHAQPKNWTLARFLQIAHRRLHRLGVRISADVFGLSATRDLGIGQVPRRISRYLDAISPMVYPSHYSAGEYNLPDPNAVPGITVAQSLRDFRRALRGRTTRLVPWLQDFSLGRTYTLADVQDQITSARAAQSSGFLLWNPLGLYSADALAP